MSEAWDVCFLSAAHPPEDVRVVLKEAATLAEAGLAVLHIAPAARAERWQAHGITIDTYTRRAGLWGRLCAIPMLARRAALSGGRALHANEPDAWVAALLAARCSGARVVLDVHEHYPSTFVALHVPRWLRRPAEGLVRGLIRVCTYLADATVVAKDGLDQDCCGRVVMARNYALLRSASVSRNPEPVPVPEIIHTGVMTRARGWPVLLKAMARMRHPARLRLIGRFTDGSEAAFWAAAERLGLLGRIRVDGWMAHAAMMREVARADIGVVLFQPGLANHRHALPHKLFDAMAVGLPVVVPADAAEVSEVVHDASCGLTVDAGDADAVAAALDRLASGVSLRAVLGTAGRKAVRKRYCWEVEGARLRGLYRDLLEGTGA